MAGEDGSRPRPLSLELPGSSLDVGFDLAQAQDGSAGPSQEPRGARQRMPTSASSSNYLLPPLPGPAPPVAQAAASQDQATLRGSRSSSFDATRRHGGPSTTSTSTTTTLTSPSPEPASSKPVPPRISTTLPRPTVIASTSSAGSDGRGPRQGASSQLLPPSAGTIHPSGVGASLLRRQDPENSSSTRRSTPSTSPQMPLLMVSDALNAVSTSSTVALAPREQQGHSPTDLLLHGQGSRPLTAPASTYAGRQSQLPADLPFNIIKPHVHLQVLPLADTITMFGSTQTTSNYSVSGKCVLSIAPPSVVLGGPSWSSSAGDVVTSPVPMSATSTSPRSLSIAHLHGAQQKSRTRSPSPLVITSLATDAEQGSSHEEAPAARTLAGGVDHEPSAATDVGTTLGESHSNSAGITLRVVSLKASFRGYALYMDHTARFSALRLADVEQECLPNGANLPIPIHQDGAAATAQGSAHKYEIDFDLAVPGWLPASLRSRFGGNFYCVAAEAILEDGRVIKSQHGLNGEAALAAAISQGASGSSAVERSGLQLTANPPRPSADGTAPGRSSAVEGLPRDRSPAYAEAAAELASKYRSSGSAPGSPLQGSSSHRGRLASGLPPLPPATFDTAQISPRDMEVLAPPSSDSTHVVSDRRASYAPGSRPMMDFDRAFPAARDDALAGAARRAMPISASMGILDTNSSRTSSATLSPNAQRSDSLPPTITPTATGSSASSSALSRFRNFRAGRQSTSHTPPLPASPLLPPKDGLPARSGSRREAPRSLPQDRSGTGIPDHGQTAVNDASVTQEDGLGSSLLTVENKKKGTKARTSWLSKRAKQLSIQSSSTSSSSKHGHGASQELESPIPASASSSGMVSSSSSRGFNHRNANTLEANAGTVGLPRLSRDDGMGRIRSSEHVDRTSVSELAPPRSSGALGLGLDARHDANASTSSRPALSVQTGSGATSGDMARSTPFVTERDDGSLCVKSEPKVIVIRRCRDVVPVPVARVAQPGVDGLNVPAADVERARQAAAAASAAGANGNTPAASAQERQVPARLVSNEVISNVSADGQTRAAIIDESEGASHGLADAIHDAEADLHPLERRERERADALEDDGLHDGEEGGELSGLLAPASTATATPGHNPDAPERQSSMNSNLPAMLPPAPSALNAPTDPHKLAAMATAARNAASTGSRSGGRRGASSTGGGPGGGGRVGGANGPTTSSSNVNGAPMRHFLHRPVLHAPAESNIEGDGLPFALTLSLPSHVHVEGANSDMLTFGLQIEVGRSAGWSRVRELGGLRLRDMELVCLQTERHSSAASRTFCSAFALPPDPQLAPEDIPILPDPSVSARKAYPPPEHRLRQGYDRDLLVNHIRMVQTGNVPSQRENNVERSRTTIVGPPPLPTKPNATGTGDGEGKDRKGKKVNRGEGHSRSKKEPRKSVMLPNLPDPLELANGGRSHAEGGPSSGATAAGGGSARGDGLNAPASASSSKPLSRSRRAYATAMNRLSNFASAMLDAGNDSDHGGNSDAGPASRSGTGGPSDGPSGERSASGGTGHRRDKDGSNSDQPRATYSFNGEDGNGVDLTKGRVRMTINLPLVPSNAEKAREMGAVQLIPDYESPYVRIRHKLKVKLGFGFGGSPLGGEGWWGQALVMCVPVRFTDSPPAEARPDAAVNTTQPSAAVGEAATSPSAPIDPIIETIASSVPILPAYTQLFREDGSRLGDEGEDLPQYPGRPEGFGKSDATENESVHALPRRPSLLRHHRGSITGPQPNTSTEDPHSNRIVPSRVVDEAAPNNGTDAQAQAAAARELAEMSDVGEAGDDDDEEAHDVGSESETDRHDTENDGDEDGRTSRAGASSAAEHQAAALVLNPPTPASHATSSPQSGNVTAEAVFHGSQAHEAAEDTASQASHPHHKRSAPGSVDGASLFADALSNISHSHPNSLKGKSVDGAGGAGMVEGEGEGEGDATVEGRHGEVKVGHEAPGSVGPATPGQFHGKEGLWALAGQEDEVRTPGRGTDASKD